MGAIPTCPAALPKRSRLALTPVGFDTPYNVWLGFSQFSPGVTHELLDLGDDVNTASLSSLEGLTRLNRRMVAPSWSGKPVPAEWLQLLPWIMDGGQTGAGTVASPYVFALGDTLSKRYALWDDTALLWDLQELAVDTATISASQGDPAVRCSLDLVGVDWTNTGTFPSGLVPANTAPFILTDACAAVTVAGTPVKVGGVSISLSKAVARDRYFNCPTIACAVSQARSVGVTLSEFPWALHPTLWSAGSAASVAVVVTFTFGVFKLKFTFPRVRHEPESPEANVPREILGQFNGMAKASAAGNDEMTAELTVSA